MVTFNLAYTAPINPPGETAAPPITATQVWAGLQRKVRHAEEFVSIITGCKVLDGETVPAAYAGRGRTATTRIATFDVPGKGSWEVKELCIEYPPCRIDFIQPDDTTVANYISQGPSGEPTDLFLTYVFERSHPDLVEGSEEARRQEEADKKLAKTAVDGSIETIRRMVANGQL